MRSGKRLHSKRSSQHVEENMLAHIVQGIIHAILPQALEKGLEAIFSDKPETKIPDRTKLTDKQKSTVILTHNKWKANVKGYEFNNWKELTDYLNKLFEVNKSISVYQRIVKNARSE